MTDLDSRERGYPQGPLDEDMEGMEARVRLKLERGERLTADEAEFFARMPADKRVEPGQVLRESREHDEMRQRLRHLPPVEDDEAREQP